MHKGGGEGTVQHQCSTVHHATKIPGGKLKVGLLFRVSRGFPVKRGDESENEWLCVSDFEGVLGVRLLGMGWLVLRL